MKYCSQAAGELVALSPPPDIVRVSSLKMLGVTVSSRLSVTDHVQNVVSWCAQTLYVLRLLCPHDLCDAALQTVYRAVVVARLLYAASAWWQFHHGRRPAAHRRISTPRRANDLTATQLVEDSDDQLFHRVQYEGGHVLQPLIADRRTNSSPLCATGDITCNLLAD